MYKILITGAAGMIGSHLCDRLLALEKYDIVAIDDLSIGSIDNLSHNFSNSNFRFIKQDILDVNSIEEVSVGIEIIVHLAARKKVGEHQPAVETLIVNGVGTVNVLEAAKKVGAKCVIASTSDVYGTSTELPFHEDGDIQLGPSVAKRWAYAASKLYSEHIGLAYYKDYGIPAVILRYFGGFSERSSFSWSGGHVPQFIDAVLNDKPVIIHGDGTQTRCMTYVEDLIEGTIKAMHVPEAIGEIINIGSTEEVSVIDCARKIHQLAGKNGEYKMTFVPFEDIFGSYYKDAKRRQPDLTKAKRILGWEPKYTLEDSLRITIEARKKSLAKFA